MKIKFILVSKHFGGRVGQTTHERVEAEAKCLVSCWRVLHLARVGYQFCGSLWRVWSNEEISTLNFLSMSKWILLPLGRSQPLCYQGVFVYKKTLFLYYSIDPYCSKYYKLWFTIEQISSADAYGFLNKNVSPSLIMFIIKCKFAMDIYHL